MIGMSLVYKMTTIKILVATCLIVVGCSNEERTLNDWLSVNSTKQDICFEKQWINGISNKFLKEIEHKMVSSNSYFFYATDFKMKSQSSFLQFIFTTIFLRYKTKFNKVTQLSWTED